MRFALRFNRIRSANCIEEGSVKRLSRHKAAHRRGASLFIPRPLDLGKEMETIDYSVCYPLTNVAGPEINDMDQPLISSHVEPQWRNNGGIKPTIGGPYHDKKEYTD